jgi:hypothetical protein
MKSDTLYSVKLVAILMALILTIGVTLSSLSPKPSVVPVEPVVTDAGLVDETCSTGPSEDPCFELEDESL